MYRWRRVWCCMKLCGRDGWAHPRNHEVLLRHLRSLRFRFSGVGLRARSLHHCEIRFGDSSGTGAAAARCPGQDHVAQRYISDIDHTGALSEAIVTLPADIKPKDSVELEIGYEGVIPLDTTRLTRIGIPEEIARRSSWDQISPSFTAVRGAGYVAWFPITTESADFSEGNSLFEVVDRWKAREAYAGMEINLCTQVADSTVTHIVMNEPSHKKGSGGGYDHHTCSGYRFDPVGTV